MKFYKIMFTISVIVFILCLFLMADKLEYLINNIGDIYIFTFAFLGLFFAGVAAAYIWPFKKRIKKQDKNIVE